MRTRTLPLQARLAGQYKRPDVRGRDAQHQLRTFMRDAARTVRSVSPDESRAEWQRVGAPAMYARLTRLGQQYRLANIRYKHGAISDTQANRAFHRIGVRTSNIKYWIAKELDTQV